MQYRISPENQKGQLENKLRDRRNMQLRIQKQNSQIDRKTLSISPYNKTPVIKNRLLNNPGRGTINDMNRG